VSVLVDQVFDRMPQFFKGLPRLWADPTSPGQREIGSELLCTRISHFRALPPNEIGAT
jgi:hypothetical protein